MKLEEMRAINFEIAEKLAEKYKDSITYIREPNKLSLVSKTYECYIKIHFSKNLALGYRLRTLNYYDTETDYYLYHQFDKKEDLDIEEYKDLTYKALDYMLGEAIDFPYCMEHRILMSP